MKRIATALVVLLVVILVVSCGAKTSTKTTDTDREQEKKIEDTKKVEDKKVTETTKKPVEEKPQTEETSMDNEVVVFETNYGTYEVTLWVGKAPIAAGNMIDKAKAGFFNNLTFHRVVNGFVIQGGDPQGTGMGGGQMNVDSLSPELSNVRGTIAMASSSRAKPITDQSDAQFFINLKDDNVFLDGMGFIAFGEVTKGMDVIDTIAKVETSVGASGEKSTPVKPVIINKAYVK